MKIPTSSLVRRNPPLMLAAVACDAARRVCEAAGRKELGAHLRGARVAAGKVTFLTGGRSVVIHELGLLSGEVAAALGPALAPFCPSPAAWKVTFA